MRRRGRQSGAILLALLFAVTVLAIGLAAAAPQIGHEIRRQREEVLIRRGNQYVRAIQRFYRKFGRLPNRIEELENTNNIRFLRQRYKDPMSRDGEWRIIRLGEARFYRPPGGLGRATGAPGTPLAQPGTAPGTAPGTPISQVSRRPGGQSLGGAPIIGVASTSEKTSIKEIHGRSRYNEWEFVYDPRFDPTLQQRPAGTPTQPGQQPRGRPGGPQAPSTPQTPPGPTQPQTQPQ